MGRTIAIDYGEKRTGIAVTDVHGIIATGLKTIATNELLDFMKQYCGSEDVRVAVIGLPKRMDNSDSEIEKHILKFIEKLKRCIPGLHVERMDERFTSKLALDAMLRGGVRKMKRRDKNIVNQVSATIILQSWMQKKQLQGKAEE